jgi:hypothetical protein
VMSWWYGIFQAVDRWQPEVCLSIFVHTFVWSRRFWVCC